MLHQWWRVNRATPSNDKVYGFFSPTHWGFTYYRQQGGKKAQPCLFTCPNDDDWSFKRLHLGCSHIVSLLIAHIRLHYQWQALSVTKIISSSLLSYAFARDIGHQIFIAAFLRATAHCPEDGLYVMLMYGIWPQSIDVDLWQWLEHSKSCWGETVDSCCWYFPFLFAVTNLLIDTPAQPTPNSWNFNLNAILCLIIFKNWSSVYSCKWHAVHPTWCRRRTRDKILLEQLT